MSILKPPPKATKNETLQLRVQEEIKTKLRGYAEFINSSESYVVSEALKSPVLKRRRVQGLARGTTSKHPSNPKRRRLAFRDGQQDMKASSIQFDNAAPQHAATGGDRGRTKAIS